MLQPSTRANGGAGRDRSDFHKMLSLIASALGIAAAIMLLPPVWRVTEKPLFDYLVQTWEPWFARGLTYVMGGVEAAVIYGTVKLSIVLTGTFGAAWITARRFPGV